MNDPGITWQRTGERTRYRGVAVFEGRVIGRVRHDQLA